MYILVLAGFGSVSGQSWGRDLYERLRLERSNINQRILTGDTDSTAFPDDFLFGPPKLEYNDTGAK